MIKSYTDVEQSKVLSKILPFESADMVHYGIHKGTDGNYHLSADNTQNGTTAIFKNDCRKVFRATTCDIENQLPCWSLAALLDVLPIGTRLLKSATDDTYHCDCPNKSTNKWYDNPVDACYEMILKLNKLKML